MPNDNRTNRAKFSLLDECASNAPEGTYEREKEIIAAVNQLTDSIMTKVKELGLKAPNGDQIEWVAGAIYGYIRDANPLEVAAGEGFGQAMRGPSRDRVLANAAANLEFLKSVGVIAR